MEWETEKGCILQKRSSPLYTEASDTGANISLSGSFPTAAMLGN